jgi:hypothetical protein
MNHTPPNSAAVRAAVSSVVARCEYLMGAVMVVCG